jgi:hypothetical protein
MDDSPLWPGHSKLKNQRVLRKAKYVFSLDAWLSLRSLVE